MVAAAAVDAGASTPAYAAACTQQTGVNVRDPNTGWTWTSYWWCPNAANATMYGDATPNTPTAQMVTTNSYFLCYRRGWVHPGGNDVWYYSQGDIALPGMGSRQAWGYMPAVAVNTHIDPWPGIPQCPDGFSPPVNADGRTTVLMLHGYHPHARMDCDGWFANAKNVYQANGYTVPQLITLKYYADDFDCDANIGTNARDYTSIATIGAGLAWYIYNNYSRWGKTVDVLAHSMGGLVIRTAITGTAHPSSWPFNSYSWPPYLYVRDVSTLGTPYEGAFPNGVLGCHQEYDDPECRELTPGSGFLNDWIKPYGNPQAWRHNGRGGTDWTLIGSFNDLITLTSSALELGSQAIVGQKIAYYRGEPLLDHMALMTAPRSGSYSIMFCQWTYPCDQSPPRCLPCQYAWDFGTWVADLDAEAPVEAAMLGNIFTTR